MPVIHQPRGARFGTQPPFHLWLAGYLLDGLRALIIISGKCLHVLILGVGFTATAAELLMYLAIFVLGVIPFVAIAFFVVGALNALHHVFYGQPIIPWK